MSIGKDPIEARPGNNILQSFTDAIAGRSMVLFYGVASTDSVGVDYVLISEAGKSFPAATTGATDIDFDITINKPTVIAGIATVDMKIEDTTGASVQYIVSVIHYDGSTETSIGTRTTPGYTGAAQYDVKLQMTVTRKLFKIGDILRVRADPLNATCRLHHDPLTANMEFKIWIPVVNME